MATKIRMEMDRIHAFCLCAYRLGINPLPSIREQYGIPVKFAYEQDGYMYFESVDRPVLFVILDDKPDNISDWNVRLKISNVRHVKTTRFVLDMECHEWEPKAEEERS